MLVHVLAAFVYGAGYIGTNMLTEFARRTDDPVLRGHALHSSGVLDRLNVTGGGFAGLSGVLTVLVLGNSLLTPWIVAASVIYVMIVGTGIFFWGRVGRAIDRSLKAGEDARVNALLRAPLNIAVSRVENVLFIVLIALMVIRPGA